ncbi:hypothetical protein GJ496_002569 [Pomphorhynchus laevis]|nr:hypothetical protein GJ496_002569 [Pomphorhynchus laevis]
MSQNSFNNNMNEKIGKKATSKEVTYDIDDHMIEMTESDYFEDQEKMDPTSTVSNAGNWHPKNEAYTEIEETDHNHIVQKVSNEIDRLYGESSGELKMLSPKPRLTRLHFPLDAFYGASWKDSWGGSNYAREPTFRTEYQDRIPNFHNCMVLSFLYNKWPVYWAVFAPLIKCDVREEVISRLNNEGNFQWRLWQGTKEYDNNRSRELMYLIVNYSMFALNAFLQESGLAVDYRLWAIHMTAPRVIDNWDIYTGSVRTYSWRQHYKTALCIEFADNAINNEAWATLLGFDDQLIRRGYSAAMIETQLNAVRRISRSNALISRKRSTGSTYSTILYMPYHPILDGTESKINALIRNICHNRINKSHN